MNVLVIGGTRFVGKHLVASLIENQHNVTIATRGVASDDFGSAVKRTIIDRTDYNSMKAVLTASTYDVIFDNLAYCSNDIKLVLDSAKCEKYIFISTTAVYNKHIDTKEDEFDPLSKSLVWCNRGDYPYDEVKRQAECAVIHAYPNVKYIAVRFPFVIGIDDYTQRLYYYVERIINEKPMFIDNYDAQMAFVRSDEAGKFMSFISESDFHGAINGASEQTISIKEISDYVTLRTGKTAILSNDGDVAPYNGEREYSINVDKATSLGFLFTPLKDWIYELIDSYINYINNLPSQRTSYL